MVLKILTGDPLHGYAIAKRIEAMSQDELRVEQGSLYPALYRLEAQGLIRAGWGKSELGRKAKFYRLTARGRKQLGAETENWIRLSQAVNRVLLST